MPLNMRMHGFQRVQTLQGRAYRRTGFTGIPFAEKKIQKIPFLRGTKLRITKAKRGNRNVRVGISEVNIKKAMRGFRTLTRMHQDGLLHTAVPLGFKTDRQTGKGYVYTLFRPGFNLKSPTYRKLSSTQKNAVNLAVIDSIKQAHEKGWILRDRNASNIISHITGKGNVVITHIDPYTAITRREQPQYFDEFANREMKYVYDMLASLK